MRRFRSMKSSPVVLHAVGTVVPLEVFDIEDEEGDRLDPDFAEVGDSVPLGLPEANPDLDDAQVVEEPEQRPQRATGARKPVADEADSTEETA